MFYFHISSHLTNVASFDSLLTSDIFVQKFILRRFALSANNNRNSQKNNFSRKIKKKSSFSTLCTHHFTRTSFLLFLQNTKSNKRANQIDKLLLLINRTRKHVSDETCETWMSENFYHNLISYASFQSILLRLSAVNLSLRTNSPVVCQWWVWVCVKGWKSHFIDRHGSVKWRIYCIFKAILTIIYRKLWQN